MLFPRNLAIVMTSALLLFGISECVFAQNESRYPTGVNGRIEFQDEVKQKIAELEVELSELKSSIGSWPDDGQSLESVINDQPVEEWATNCESIGVGDDADGDPWQGSFPNSIRIPNSDVSFKVGGFIKVDMIHDFNAIAS